ncbi:hypothetical protein A0H81_05521 [Grifola frondosa]|uniref:Uncharacterized protein n=1 Tax=Grifola frondosa TaxID=5627 RepID=A0A1C7MD01_GRIFR|nr:hypothetical protein A0H81_05521 [Grifola frondosa]
MLSCLPFLENLELREFETRQYSPLPGSLEEWSAVISTAGRLRRLVLPTLLIVNPAMSRSLLNPELPGSASDKEADSRLVDDSQRLRRIGNYFFLITLASTPYRNEELQRRKADAEKDRELFRELYGKASAYASDVTKENNETPRASNSCGKPRQEVEKWKSLCNMLTTRDQRTDDEVRRKAALELELREENARLKERLEGLEKACDRMEDVLDELAEDESPPADRVSLSSLRSARTTTAIFTRIYKKQSRDTACLTC